ncbi:MAG TPA: lamin tail domain-containing protein [Saprospiraceae bacterium]|nr:lamin tail domain-containing protein [Saprospiraceae bacterium]HNT18960.1 lamin tail domain-containing protein [Saprospiraceae bacterium]
MKRKYLIWSVFALLLFASSCVKDELFNGPATLSNVKQVPVAPNSSEDVLVTARITDLKGIASVNLLYRVIAGGTFSSIPMTSTAQYEYQGTIPATPFGTKVEYYIEVLNSGGFTSRYPEVENQFANYTVGASNLIKLYINEVFADGTKDETDPDWVEIYNGSDIPVDISGYSFYDQGIKTGGKPKRVLNAGTIIPSKAFFVLKTEYTGGEYAIEFGLSTSGDAVYLENAAGILVASLDFQTISLSGKKSYGRQPDGSDNLVVFTTPTRGTSNNH